MGKAAQEQTTFIPRLQAQNRSALSRMAWSWLSTYRQSLFLTSWCRSPDEARSGTFWKSAARGWKVSGSAIICDW